MNEYLELDGRNGRHRDQRSHGNEMPASSSVALALPLMVALFDALGQRQVRYCQWKGAPRLPEAMRGESDFDILVDRSDSRRFKEILYYLDFKPVASRFDEQSPSIENYLGFDASTGRLVHLHVYYRLILEDQQRANTYDLPLEGSFLDNAPVRDGIKIPSPELQVVVLVLRALLKYRDRDVIRDVLRPDRSPGPSSAILADLRHVLAQTDADRVARVLEEEVPFISPGPVLQFLSTVQKSPRDGWAFYRLRQQIRRELAPFRRPASWWTHAQYYWRVLTREGPLRRITQRLWGAPVKRKCPVTGGLTVALIGADGAGKSTVVRDVAAWLSWKLRVRIYYMGTSQPSFATTAMKAISTLARNSHVGCRRILGERNLITQLAASAKDLSTCCFLLAQGMDRYRRYQDGHRQAAQGTIVIYDRYPLKPTHPGLRVMDGPRIAGLGDSPLEPIIRRARRFEESLYHKVRPADHFIVLHVSPEVARRRKPEHRLEALEAKHLAVQHIASDGLALTHVDANQPLDQVLLHVKSTLWQLL